MFHDIKSRTEMPGEEAAQRTEDERVERCSRGWRPPRHLPQEEVRGGGLQDLEEELYIDHTAKVGKLGQELKVIVIKLSE